MESPDYCRVIVVDSMDWQKNVYATVVVENGGRYTVTIDENDRAKVEGSQLNDAVQAYKDTESDINDEFKALFEKYDRNSMTEEQKTAMDEEREGLYNRMVDNLVGFVKNNINNPGAWETLYNAGMMAETVQDKKDLIAGAEGKTLELPEYKNLVETIEVLERTAEGQMFTDLTMDDPDGNKMSLSDYAGKGKYILVDFWASWCGPCKAEMPNVVKAYNDFKDKGFDIVSISFDSNKDRWVAAISEWQMPWHHMSDLKGWQSEGSKVYAVHAIPHTMLIDKDGTILAHNLRGEDLYTKLAELMP